GGSRPRREQNSRGVIEAAKPSSSTRSLGSVQPEADSSRTVSFRSSQMRRRLKRENARRLASRLRKARAAAKNCSLDQRVLTLLRGLVSPTPALTCALAPPNSHRHSIRAIAATENTGSAPAISSSPLFRIGS